MKIYEAIIIEANNIEIEKTKIIIEKNKSLKLVEHFNNGIQIVFVIADYIPVILLFGNLNLNCIL